MPETVKEKVKVERWLGWRGLWRLWTALEVVTVKACVAGDPERFELDWRLHYFMEED